MSETMIRKNHMDVLWHEYTDKEGQNLPIVQASLTEKASIIGRAGIMLLSCGTGAWRVRSSMNTLAEVMGVTCTADIGLMSIEYTCFDGQDGFTQSLCLTNTGVNTSKLNRLEHFIQDFETEGKDMSGEQLHNLLDNIEEIHGLYSPIALGIAAALACGGFAFLLGGGPIEMFCAFVGAGLGNFLRCKLTKHHYTLFLGIVLSVSLACLSYAGLLKLGEIFLGLSVKHEAGYICAMLFIIPGFPFITSGIDMAKQDMRSGFERLAYAIKIGYKVCIITGGRGRTLENRLRMLGIDHFYVDCMDKITAIREYMAGQGLDPANVIYMGDDIPDLDCMREVGLPVCPADAAAEVIEASRYVSEFRGGEGAVRDIVEQVLRARGDWAKNSEGVTPSSLAASR